MKKSKVYFSDLRCKVGTSLPQKLARLLKAAGFEKIDFQDKFAAVKIHFGEPGNLAFLRPNWAKVVCDYVKELGGKPFLTDCNTLYVGGRKNALDHLDSAYENGFNPFCTGVHAIIADGLKGTEETLVPVEGGEYVKEAKIGSAIMSADVVISLSHFKGHECTGFGGALKNLGMGCGSRAGKMEMHCDGKPTVKTAKCRGCGMCAKICANNGIRFENKKAFIDHDTCLGCGRCIAMCNFDAIIPTFGQSEELLNKKIAEYALAVVKDKPHFHINMAIDISPCCDCHSENDIPIVPNVGMFASFDPVAIDMASADGVNAMPANPQSVLGRKEPCCKDHFTNSYPNTNWRVQVEHAEHIGLGSTEYELVLI